MLAFLQSDNGFAAAISALVTFVSLLVAHWLRGRVNLITFSPNSSFFQFATDREGAHPIRINSAQIMIQNLGRLPATEVEIIAGQGDQPAGYNIVPPINHTVDQTASGHWMVRIPFVAPKEVVTIQLLNGPMIDMVRCKEGLARVVPVIHQRLYPKYMTVAVGALMVIGIFSLAYWLTLLVV